MASDDGSPTGRTKIGSRLSSILQELHERQSIQSPKSPVAPAPIKLTAYDEIVIGIMGATGVGKSSFIRLVTGDDQVQVGRGLKSMTKDVEPFTFRCKTSGISYCIIDTPGFNDTYLTDNDVLKAIASWLEKDAVRMNGIIYLHRISDPRMEGSALRNLRMFRQLCGEDFMKNVILATTFWDTVSEATGVAREKELLETDGFFKEMKDQGCDIVRISRDYDESLRLLSRFIEKRPTVMKIQQELLDGKSLASTAAASAINEELAELQRQNSVKMADAAHQARGIVLKSELNLALTRKLNQRAFEETLDEAREKHEEVAREMEEMEEKTAQRLETLNQEKNHQEQAFKVELGALSEQLKKLNSARIG